MNKNQTRARELVSRYMRYIESIPGAKPEASEVLNALREVLNVAHPKLFPDAESLAAAAAGQLLHLSGKSSRRKMFEAAKALAQYFVSEYWNGDASLFAPGSRQFGLIQSAFEYAASQALVSVSDLARKATPEGGEIATTRRLIQTDIKAKRLPALRVGKQYVIRSEDAAVWLANPARGSRSEADDEPDPAS